MGVVMVAIEVVKGDVLVELNFRDEMRLVGLARNDLIAEGLEFADEGFELKVIEIELLGTTPDADVLGTADKDGGAVEATYTPVLVYSIPTTPMIVCAIPSGTEKVPCPVSQSQAPSSISP